VIYSGPVFNRSTVGSGYGYMLQQEKTDTKGYIQGTDKIKKQNGFY